MSANTEQMEAEELNTRPRIVITAEKMFVFSPEGTAIELPPEQMLAVASLLEFLRALPESWR